MNALINSYCNDCWLINQFTISMRKWSQFCCCYLNHLNFFVFPGSTTPTVGSSQTTSGDVTSRGTSPSPSATRGE